ncbi:MAG: helix-turn-helix transcriptional regulator [Vicinamibacterales bacterium]
MRLATSEHLILTLLARDGASYGLQLVEASRGKLKRGGIYVTLGRMEDKGLVRSKPAEGGRRLYAPTALGERALLAARIFAGEIRLGAKA